MMEEGQELKKDGKDTSLICSNILKPLSSIFRNDTLNPGKHRSMGHTVTLKPRCSPRGKEIEGEGESGVAFE